MHRSVRTGKNELPSCWRGACLGAVEPRDSQGAGSMFRVEELSLGMTVVAGRSCRVRSKQRITRAGGTGETPCGKWGLVGFIETWNHRIIKVGKDL